MYTPKAFEGEISKVRRLIEENSFATVISAGEDGQPFVNHLPMIFSPEKSEEEVLIGHMSRRNPQWIHFQKNQVGTVLFHGPHTYITPRWYKSGRDVPTWNYAVVHLRGKVELIEEFEKQVRILSHLSSYFERRSPTPWKFELPDDLRDRAALTSAIISFKFRVERTEAKFKFSQNRPQEDRDGVIAGLEERTDELSAKVRRLMIEEPEEK